MRIKWFGHSCFYIVSDKGTRILTDPFDTSVGYDIPGVEADMVTVSHSHFDHNYTCSVRGDFEEFDKPGRNTFRDIEINGIPTFHDETGGRKRGENVVFNLFVDGLNVCHLGDLGHIPDNNQLNEIGNVDILLIPVGGTFTVGVEEAVKVVGQLQPETVIPMHYKTSRLKFNLASEDVFVSRMQGYDLINRDQIEVTRNNIREYKNKIVILDYK